MATLTKVKGVCVNMNACQKKTSSGNNEIVLAELPKSREKPRPFKDENVTNASKKNALTKKSGLDNDTKIVSNKDVCESEFVDQKKEKKVWKKVFKTKKSRLRKKPTSLLSLIC